MVPSVLGLWRPRPVEPSAQDSPCNIASEKLAAPTVCRLSSLRAPSSHLRNTRKIASKPLTLSAPWAMGYARAAPPSFASLPLPSSGLQSSGAAGLGRTPECCWDRTVRLSLAGPTRAHASLEISLATTALGHLGALRSPGALLGLWFSLFLLVRERGVRMWQTWGNWRATLCIISLCAPLSTSTVKNEL